MQFNINSMMDQAWWRGAGHWPKGNSSHVFLAAALHEVGRALMGEEWTGREPEDEAAFDMQKLYRAAMPVVPRPLPPPVPISLSGNDWRSTQAHNKRLEDERSRADAHVVAYRESLRLAQARTELEAALASTARLTRAMEWLQAQGAEEDRRLVTKGRLVTGGDYYDLPPSVWNAEPLWLTRFSKCQFAHRGLSTYIFLTRESVDKCLAKVPKPKGSRTLAQ